MSKAALVFAVLVIAASCASAGIGEPVLRDCTSTVSSSSAGTFQQAARDAAECNAENARRMSEWAAGATAQAYGVTATAQAVVVTMTALALPTATATPTATSTPTLTPTPEPTVTSTPTPTPQAVTIERVIVPTVLVVVTVNAPQVVTTATVEPATQAQRAPLPLWQVVAVLTIAGVIVIGALMIAWRLLRPRSQIIP